MVAFDIPNKPASPTALQEAKSTVFSCDLQAMIAAYKQNGVLSGCGLTQSGSPDMNVVVAAGWIQIDGILYSVTGGNAAVGNNASGNPRIDLISVNSSGTITVTAGTASATPDAPEIPANNILLGLVYVANGETALTNDEIFNRQALITPRSANGILFTDPTVAGLTNNLNHSTGTYDRTSNQQLKIHEVGTSSYQVRGWYKTAPATPYTITAYIESYSYSANVILGCLFFRESATSELVTFGYNLNATTPILTTTNFNSATSLNANANLTNSFLQPKWWRIADNGTNRIVSVSMDGVNWIAIFTVGRTSFLTADQVGFGVVLNTGIATCICHSWKEE